MDRDGTIRWRRRRLFVSSALYGQLVEVEPCSGERWEVRFGAIVLGTIEARSPDRLLPAPRPRQIHYLELVPREPR